MKTTRIGLMEVRETDIRVLASHLEEVASCIQYPTKRQVITILHSLVDSFARGSGLRIGNYASLDKHLLNVSELSRMVTNEIITSDRYPILRKAGLDHIETWIEAMKEYIERSE